MTLSEILLWPANVFSTPCWQARPQLWLTAQTSIQRHHHKPWHCVKSVRIQSYSGPHFFRIWTKYGDTEYSVRMRENAEKMRTRITLNMDTFYAVKLSELFLYVPWKAPSNSCTTTGQIYVGLWPNVKILKFQVWPLCMHYDFFFSKLFRIFCSLFFR